MQLELASTLSLPAGLSGLGGLGGSIAGGSSASLASLVGSLPASPSLSSLNLAAAVPGGSPRLPGAGLYTAGSVPGSPLPRVPSFAGTPPSPSLPSLGALPALPSIPSLTGLAQLGSGAGGGERRALEFHVDRLALVLRL